ncbi:AAA family ATPase [Candidatus Electronema sp. JC]|uniref:ExeA family protein n=1 Tax=Candidatus Electronema sp. JC TaxID=3401570 RepID=UPI003B42CE8F
MHLEYFGLAKPPFAGEPDTDVFFPEADRTALLRRIYTELQNGSPVVRLTGAEGSGKSLFCLLLAHLLPAEYQTVYLASPAGSFDELLRAACQELGQPPQADMSAWLGRLLEQCQAQGKKFLLLIDQAELMFPAALERLLRTVFTAAEQQTLQVVLAGRPALNERISQLQAYCADIEMPPSHQLAPLTEEELAAYLSFRLKTAGLSAADSGKAFSGEAVRKISELTKGNLRATHLLADTALQRVCAADRYFPVLAADVTALENGASSRTDRKKAALSSRTWKLLTAAVLLLFAALLFRYSGELRRSGQEAAERFVAAGTPAVKPDELLPEQLQLNSKPELPSEPEEPAAAMTEEEAVMPSEPAEAAAPLPEEESLNTPPPEEPSETSRPEAESAAAPPSARLPPEIVRLSPGMRKTRPAVKKTEPVPSSPVPAPERAAVNADQLYQELLAAGGLLRNSRSAGRYTIQLATLASRETAKEMIVRDEYLEHRRQLKLLRRPSPASPTFIFYGSYDSLEAAQAAVSQMPLFLRKQHHPAALPVAEALGKVGN